MHIIMFKALSSIDFFLNQEQTKADATERLHNVLYEKT